MKLNLHLSCLRNLLRIKRQDTIPDTKVLNKVNIPSISTLLVKAQLRWTGYVTRMTCTRLPKQIFFGELKNGYQVQGGPKKRYKGTKKASLKSFGVDLQSWESLAQDGSAWRRKVQEDAVFCESRKRSCAMLKSQRGKSAKEGFVGCTSERYSSCSCSKSLALKPKYVWRTNHDLFWVTDTLPSPPEKYCFMPVCSLLLYKWETGWDTRLLDSPGSG